MENLVRYELDDEVAIITMDDDKVNALSPAMMRTVGMYLDRAREEANAVVLAGRPGRFSAGFDLRLFTEGPEAARPMVFAGLEFFMKLYGFPLPVVAACTGHALAGGALLLLCSDARVGARGEFKIGLNGVSIGIPLPVLVQRLAGDRLDVRRLTEAILLSTVYHPDGAAEIGYLDEVVESADVLERSRQRAATLARLPRRTFMRSKELIRGESINSIRDALEADIERILTKSRAGQS